MSHSLYYPAMLAALLSDAYSSRWPDESECAWPQLIRHCADHSIKRSKKNWEVSMVCKGCPAHTLLAMSVKIIQHTKQYSLSYPSFWLLSMLSCRTRCYFHGDPVENCRGRTARSAASCAQSPATRARPQQPQCGTQHGPNERATCVIGLGAPPC